MLHGTFYTCCIEHSTPAGSVSPCRSVHVTRVIVIGKWAPVGIGLIRVRVLVIGKQMYMGIGLITLTKVACSTLTIYIYLCTSCS